MSLAFFCDVVMLLNLVKIFLHKYKIFYVKNIKFFYEIIFNFKSRRKSNITIKLINKICVLCDVIITIYKINYLELNLTHALSVQHR